MTNWLGVYAGHDSNAAYVRDGYLVSATEEERITRQKHFIGHPQGAIADVGPGGNNYKTVAATPHLDWLKFTPDETIDHHLAHAAYAYCTSGFEQAKVAVIDGGGDKLWAAVYEAKPGSLTPITETTMKEGGCPFGQLYGRVTAALGFRTLHDEGKVMGLAAYQDSQRFSGLFDNSYVVCGQYLYANPDYDWSGMFSVVANNKAEQSAFIAAALQEYFVKIALVWITANVEPEDNLCVAGGVFANVKLNQELLKVCNRLYVAPAMNDGGLGAGAALYAAGLQPKAQYNVFLGYDLGELKADPLEIANRLVKGEIVALAHGRMEYGPRALGHRSILAHPGIRRMEQDLNTRLGRKEFMPFAPVMLEECAGDILIDYTDLNNQPSARHMTLSYYTDCELLTLITHVDGTVRPQVIGPDAGLYYDILKEFYRLTDVPALINTSLNIHGEPIVRTGDEARITAERAGLELYLAQ